MKNLSTFGKVNLGIGVLFCIFGIFKLWEEISTKVFVLSQSISIALLAIGVSISLAASFFKRKEN